MLRRVHTPSSHGGGEWQAVRARHGQRLGLHPALTVPRRRTDEPRLTPAREVGRVRATSARCPRCGGSGGCRRCGRCWKRGGRLRQYVWRKHAPRRLTRLPDGVEPHLLARGLGAWGCVVGPRAGGGEIVRGPSRDVCEAVPFLCLRPRGWSAGPRRVPPCGCGPRRPLRSGAGGRRPEECSVGRRPGWSRSGRPRPAPGGLRRCPLRLVLREQPAAGPMRSMTFTRSEPGLRRASTSVKCTLARRGRPLRARSRAETARAPACSAASTYATQCGTSPRPSAISSSAAPRWCWARCSSPRAACTRPVWEATSALVAGMVAFFAATSSRPRASPGWPRKIIWWDMRVTISTPRSGCPASAAAWMP
jgi:hypothetical protein